MEKSLEAPRLCSTVALHYVIVYIFNTVPTIAYLAVFMLTLVVMLGYVARKVLALLNVTLFLK